MQSNYGSQNAPTPQSVRIIHGALAAGVIMFAIVAHFVMVPTANPNGGLAPLIPMLLTIALASCAVATLLMKRVPRPAEGETAGAFWLRAAPPALLTWMPIEGAALLSIVVYSLTASKAAIVVAGIAVLIFLLLRPGYFESR